MPVSFDFTYNIVPESVQNEALNAIANTKKKEYEPISHFFTDETKLALPLAGNVSTDAFGPVGTVAPATKYRTTSIVRAIGNEPVKVLAICSGQVAIIPQTGDNTKLNLILKPSAAYAPLKIKYFIYRGIRKSDLMGTDNLMVESNTSDPSQPSFLQKLRLQFVSFYLDVDSEIPPTFPASLIGFNSNQQSDLLIDDLFTKRNSEESYQMPNCDMGEHLGNFTGEIGMDIILDYGDYELTNQQELFKLNLDYACRNQFVFDVAPISDSTVRLRYKENILQFLDAAAFWGSHIECGLIKLASNSAGIKTNAEIYTQIVNKYQTKNKIYVYVEVDNGRSYNFNDSTRTVEGFGATGPALTLGWPILIKELNVSGTPFPDKKNVSISLDYIIIASDIPEYNRHISIDIISPNNNTSIYPFLERPKDLPSLPPSTLVGRTATLNISFQTETITGQSCAGFLMVYANLGLGEMYLDKYYNNLWPLNINTNLSIPINDPFVSNWCNYDRNRLVNLDEVLRIGASIQNKVFFDTGFNPDATVPEIAVKKRRLYMGIIKSNTSHDTESDSFNIDTVTAGISKNTSTKEEYLLNLYNDSAFSIYKGTFSDGGDIINSLVLYNDTNLLRKNSYFHLGITEEEYNKLIYDNPVVPTIVPPATTPTQFLPIDADNVFLHLEEDTSFLDQNVTKYKVGMRYEDIGGGNMVLFPAVNNVYVYSLDGFFFFSKEYSEYQQYYNEFAKAKVEFRTLMDQNETFDNDYNVSTPEIPFYVFNPPTNIPSTDPFYNGEFGFDWLRIGDNGEKSYESVIMGGYEIPAATDSNTIYEYNGITGVFNDAAKALKSKYKSIPTQVVGEKYFIPYLNLFSKAFSNSFSSSIQLPFEAQLRVLVEMNDAMSKLEFDYDSSFFTIDKPILADVGIKLKSESIDKTVKITCLKDFNESKQIQVLAYPYGVTDKSEAKVAGIILVGNNGSSVRREEKFVLVRVKTNVNFNPSTGSFGMNEKTNFINAMSHSYIAPTFEEVPSYFLDLSNDPDYKVGGQFVDGGTGRINEDAANFFPHLRNLFINEKDTAGNAINVKYTDYFTVFAFDTPPYDTTVGQVEDIGVRNMILLPNRNDRTFSHEGMHGLGLLHTHSDGPITNPNQEFVYNKYHIEIPVHIDDVTDNYMSYAGTRRKSTWYWQWKIINKSIK